MKFVIVLACFVACAVAAPKDYKDIPIVAYDNVVEHDGKYKYSFETGDGTKQAEEGVLKVFDAETAAETAKGSFSYPGEDGKTYSVTYVADENGFQPKGDHLPTSPPVPEAIARALAYLATVPPPKN